jgi:hypothetical protein
MFAFVGKQFAAIVGRNTLRLGHRHLGDQLDFHLLVEASQGPFGKR